MTLARPSAAILVGLGLAGLVAALVDRGLAVWGLGAPERSVEAWVAALGLHAALVGLAGVVLGWLGIVERAAGRRHGRRAMIGFAGVVALLGLWPVAREITAGPWISAQPYAPWLAVGLPLAGGGLVATLVGLARRWPPHSESASASARGYTMALALVGMAIPALALRMISPLEFPRTHMFAVALSSLLLTAAGLRLTSGQAKRSTGGSRVAAVSLVGVAITGMASWARVSPGAQAELLLYAPTSATVMRTLGLARKDYLPALLATPVEQRSAPPRYDIRRPLPRGASIIWLTVDTLRADALPPRRGAGESPAAPGDTPFIDELMAQSVVFADAHAQGSKTVVSMPPMFRSLESFEDPDQLGQPLGEAMAAHGYRTLAVVNEWFLVARVPLTHAMLEGFERVEVYQPHDTAQAVPWALELVDEAGDAPFVLWLHLYSSHHPGFAGRPLTDADGPWPTRYRSTVQWLDGEVQALWKGLEARGLGDRVVFVFGSDHGEGLGANGVARHGESVFEEELAVPLFIRAPGIDPGLVDASVGNVDVLPTLFELVGIPPDAMHRGHSLVPLLDDPQRPWSQAYYARNGPQRIITLIDGHDKVILDTESGVVMRFGLEQDPTEDVNLFTDSEDDRRLLFRLLRRNPTSLVEGLEDGDETTRALLIERVRSIDASTSDEELDFMLRLVPHDPLGDASAAVAERFDAVEDLALRLSILQHLFADDPERWSERLVAWLERSEDPSSILIGLAQRGQPTFASAWVAARLDEALGQGIDPALPWLELVAGWKDVDARDFLGPVTTALRLAHEHPSHRAAMAALTLARELGGLDPHGDGASALAAAIVPFTRGHDPPVEIVAVTALARHPEHDPRLAALIDDGARDLRVRQAALRAVGHARGDAAVDFIERAAKNPRMMIVSILLLGEIASERALAALLRLRDQPMSAWNQQQAAKAIGGIRRHRSGHDEG